MGSLLFKQSLKLCHVNYNIFHVKYIKDNQFILECMTFISRIEVKKDTGIKGFTFFNNCLRDGINVISVTMYWVFLLLYTNQEMHR